MVGVRGCGSPGPVVLVLALLLQGGSATAQTGPLPDEAPLLGRPVPDVRIVTGGTTVSLSGLWGTRPLLLALVFSRCAGICSPFLASLKAAKAALPGPDDYLTIVLSFDPRDTAQDMRELARRLGLEGRADWLFGVGASEGEVDRLAGALGFWYRWDEARMQFDHPALLAAVERGRVRRLLVGGDVRPARLDEVVRELRGDFVAAYPLPGKVLFRCFQFDPVRGRLVLDWGLLLLLAPAVLAVIATLSLFAAGRRLRAAGSA